MWVLSVWVSVMIRCSPVITIWSMRIIWKSGPDRKSTGNCHCAQQNSYNLQLHYGAKKKLNPPKRTVTTIDDCVMEKNSHGYLYTAEAVCWTLCWNLSHVEFHNMAPACPEWLPKSTEWHSNRCVFMCVCEVDYWLKLSLCSQSATGSHKHHITDLLDLI